MTVTAAQNDNGALIASLNTAGTGGQSAIGEVSDRFLKLLVTQLQNQDPMNPLDNAEMTSQLAQMSTVEGINKLDDSLAMLLQGYRVSQSLQAASLVGHTVLAEGEVLTLAGSVAGGGVELGAAADTVRLNILDGAGQVVRSLDLGAQEAGIVRFGWDGLDDRGQPLADGYYALHVEASRGGQAVAATPLALASVSSVVFENEAMRVELAGLTQVGIGQIKQIY